MKRLYRSKITGLFLGWKGNNKYKLKNGSVWVQNNKCKNFRVSYFLLSPEVAIWEDNEEKFFQVKGTKEIVQVNVLGDEDNLYSVHPLQQTNIPSGKLRLITHCKINGGFLGWEGYNVIRLNNGQMWKQADSIRAQPIGSLHNTARIWNDGVIYFMEIYQSISKDSMSYLKDYIRDDLNVMVKVEEANDYDLKKWDESRPWHWKGGRIS